MDGAPSPHRHQIFLLAALGVLMASIDLTVVAVALPQLMDALQAPLTWVGWTITAYELVQLLVLPVAGKFSDTLGRKRVFLFCLGTFTLGSLLCGLAPSVGSLIAFRALQAVGGGGLMPSAVGIVSDQYGKHRARAIGLLSSVLPIGGIIGPNLGGFILEHWTWRELFFINVPIGIVVCLGMWRLLGRHEMPRQPLRVDLAGLALFAGSVGSFMLGMTTLGDHPELAWSPVLWAVFASSLVLVVVFLRHIRRAANPVVDYQLLARNPFLAANLYNFFFGSVVFGFFSFVPYYAVVRYGMSPFQSGAVLTPRGIAMVITSTLSSLFVIRWSYRFPMLGGMLLIALSLILIGQDWTLVLPDGSTVQGFWLLAGILTISGVGMGLANPASNNAAIDLAPHQAAEMTGIRGMFRLTGGALSISATTLGLSFFPDKAHGLETTFRVLAVVLVLTAVPLTLMIPDTALERWLREHRRRGPSVPSAPRGPAPQRPAAKV
jgi:EmrB/QacA subfamily drug resistance transporter